MKPPRQQTKLLKSKQLKIFNYLQKILNSKKLIEKFYK